VPKQLKKKSSEGFARKNSEKNFTPGSIAIVNTCDLKRIIFTVNVHGPLAGASLPFKSHGQKYFYNTF